MANVDNTATGIILIRRSTEVTGSYWPALTYLSISVSLNVLLTFMIIIRLVLHTRNTRAALGMTGLGGLSKSIVTMLVESCALYSASSLLVLGPMSADNNPISNFFIPVLPATQVRAFNATRSPDRLSDIMSDWTGHRFAPHHSKSC